MLQVLDVMARELILFAAVGLFIGGVDDLCVDLLFLVRRWHRGHGGRVGVTDLASPRGGTVAVLVPAWDEAAVIGGMLRAALARFDHPDYRLYVGVYPNDPETIAAVEDVAAADARVRMVVGERPGPTTKADCLNALWRALRRDAAAGLAIRAIAFHDAEDVVHPHELRVFDALIGVHDVVQIPVLPLVKRGARLVSGHYADEFAEAHGKQMVVRTAVGAGMPLAGTGCAVSPAMLARVAAERGGDPFDADSLVEDYELGLRIAGLGGRSCFARIDDGAGSVVAVRAYFPATVDAAVRQKSRWMTGIALAGWDPTGWARPLAVADHWMRMRDRRAPIAVVVLAAAYLGVAAWLLSGTVHWLLASDAATWPRWADRLLAVNAGLLAWRVAARAAVTRRAYGGGEAWWSLPRLVVGNLVALLAAQRAMGRYVALLRGAALRWDKTRHEFPEIGPAATA